MINGVATGCRRRTIVILIIVGRVTSVKVAGWRWEAGFLEPHKLGAVEVGVTLCTQTSIETLRGGGNSCGTVAVSCVNLRKVGRKRPGYEIGGCRNFQRFDQTLMKWFLE